MAPEQNGSLTNGHLALQYFTNRHKFTRQFAEYLNDDPPPTKILFFHGDGGNGKSLLLKFLLENCCKRFVPKIWQQLKTKSDDEFTAIIEKDELNDYITTIPAAILDIGQPSIEEDKPQDRFYGLLMLRRKLAIVASKLGCKLKFPRYDFACVWYLHEKGKSLAEINKLFPPEEMELIGALVDALEHSVLANVVRAALNTLTKHLGQKVILFWKKWGVDEQWLTQLKTMELETELMDTLPHWFAQDLNATMKNDDVLKRIVLFFDTYEAFWGHEHNLPEEKFFYRDEWLRRLLGDLDLSTGIVVVVAGREKPRWAESPKFPILPEKVDTQLVCHLSDADAIVYLQNANIFDAGLQQALIKYASVKPNEVHPFFLSLCADVVLVAKRRGTTLNAVDFAAIPGINVKSRELTNRLLRYVDKEIEYAIHALSACRTFNRKLYFILGDALHFNATPTTFDIIAQFSFVWHSQSEEGETWYRIHDLLRRLYHKHSDVTKTEAHAILEQHYREQEKVADAIYHRFYQNQERGIEEWNEVFITADNQRNEELCRTLQKIRNELGF
jgi:hypothetical protein